MFGGKNKTGRKSNRMKFLEEAYLDNRLSKSEAERRVWKAISFLATNESAHKSR
ncbi:MAG: hypothetical protein Q7S57_06115 [bacterium]|nr:hypothetical protein [bacterium]